MSLLNDEFFIPINVTFNGEKDRTQYRQMAATGAGNIRKEFRNNADGSTTMLSFQGNLHEVTTILGADNSTLDFFRSLSVGAVCLAGGLSEQLGKFVVSYHADTGKFSPYKTKPVVETPTGYRASTGTPASDQSALPALKRFSDVFNLSSGDLYISTVKKKSFGESGIPVVLKNLCHGEFETHTHDDSTTYFDVQDYHVFSVARTLSHSLGRGGVKTTVDVGAAIVDALPPTVETLESGIMIDEDTNTVAFYGATATKIGYNDDYLNGYAYLASVALSSHAPYISAPQIEVFSYGVSPSSDPSVGAPALVLARVSSASLPVSVPSKAMGLPYEKNHHVPTGVWDGPSQYYRFEVEYGGVMPLNVTPSSLNAYNGKTENNRSGTETIGKVTDSLGNVESVVRTWATSCSYEFTQQNGSYWTEYRDDLPLNQRPPGFGDEYGRWYQSVDYGWFITHVADGSGSDITSQSKMNLNITVGSRRLVDISSDRSDTRRTFSGWILVDNPGWVQQAIHLAQINHDQEALQSAWLRVPYNDPSRVAYNFSIIGYRYLMYAYREGDYASSRITRTVNDDIRTSDDTISVYAEDVMYYDPRNDIEIKFVFSGGANKNSSTFRLSLVVNAKGTDYEVELCSGSGSGIDLIADWHSFVLNADPPCYFHPVPANIPGVFAPACEQGSVDYLCYTTAEEEDRFRVAGANNESEIRQYLISLRLWFGRAQRFAEFEDPKETPSGAQYIRLFNIEPCAQLLNGGIQMLYSMYYTLKQFTFSNEGMNSFEKTLWPNTADDKIITCWRV